MKEDNVNQPAEQVILEVAEKLFLEKGFESTSTTQIAREVGCNQALIHYYFRTKENLFNTIFENKFRLFFEGIFNTENIHTLSFADKIKHIVESHFDLIQQNPRIPTLILNELSRQPKQLSILREKLHALPEKLFLELNGELEQEIILGRIRKISLMDIIISVVSLNVALFIMMPVAENVLQLNEEQKNALINHRRSENADFILKSLRP